MKITQVTIDATDVPNGTEFDAVCEVALGVSAKHGCDVAFTFNGIPMTVSIAECVEKVYRERYFNLTKTGQP